MTNPNKRKGDVFEAAIRDYARTHGFPWAERTRAGHHDDHGDVHLAPGVIVQAKNRRQWDVAGWVVELAAQKAAAKADHAVLVVKRPRVSDPGRAYAVLEVADLLLLLRAAGYGHPLGEERSA